MTTGWLSMPWLELRRRVGQLPLMGQLARTVYRRLRGPVPPRPLSAYEQWLKRRLLERRADYPAHISGAPIIEVLTLTHETRPDVLRRTAAGVFQQDYAGWRWLIWDNGSTNPQTQQILDELARDPRVTVVRHPVNLGITAGHRQALLCCRQEYIAFLDHDDLLTPDALRIMAWAIVQYARPEYLYSDEDKINLDDVQFCPFFKPDFSPALLQTTPYPCHLAVARRRALLAVNAFSDPAVEGTQDWDTVLRLWEAGGRVLHVPEILYSWRAVPGSTALKGRDAKPYVIQAQQHCLQQSLCRRGLAKHFELRPHPLFAGVDGHWWPVRRAENTGPLVEVVVLADRTPADLDDCLTSLVTQTEYPCYRIRVIDGLGLEQVAHCCRRWARRFPGLVRLEQRPQRPRNEAELFNDVLHEQSDEPAAYLAVFPVEALLATRSWLWEALGCFERCPRAVVVGGRQFDANGYLVGGASLFGQGGAVGVGYAGRPRSDPGYFHLHACHRNALAVQWAPWVIHRSRAIELGGFDSRFPLALHEVDFGARAYRAGFEVVVSPMIVAIGPGKSLSAEALETELSVLAARHGDLVRDDPFYCPFLDLDPALPYQIAEPAIRAGCLQTRLLKQAITDGRGSRQENITFDSYDLSRRHRPQPEDTTLTKIALKRASRRGRRVYHPS